MSQQWTPSSSPSPMGAPYADYRGGNLSVTITGLSELVARFGSADSFVKEQLIDVIRAISNEGVKLAVATLDSRRAPFHSGELAASVRIIPPSAGAGGVSGGYGAFAFYAYWVEFGRGPVFPIRARMLSWIDPWTGARVFAHSAGPAAPRPFLMPTLNDVSPFATKRSQQAMAAIVAYLAG